MWCTHILLGVHSVERTGIGKKRIGKKRTDVCTEKGTHAHTLLLFIFTERRNGISCHNERHKAVAMYESKTMVNSPLSATVVMTSQSGRDWIE